MPKRPDEEALRALCARIGHRFADEALLLRALTHRSAAAEHMERLEFLGDAVLNLVIARALFERFPNQDEGMLTRMRARLVCREQLGRIARRWRLPEVLIVGEGERVNGRLKSPSIAANAVEALIGAVFADAGFDRAASVVLAAWEEDLSHVVDEDVRDPKTRLQEFTQARGWGLPDYRVTDRGAGRHPRFLASCRIQGRELGQGTGERKKQAETAAAAAALRALEA